MRPTVSALRSASSEIATYLASILTVGAYRPGVVVPQGKKIGVWCLSASEHAEYLLKHKLDLAIHEEGHVIVLAKPTSAFPDHFASGRYDGCFDKILGSYVGFLEWKGEVPTRRRWFAPPPNHRHFLTLLAELGYLEAGDGKLRWTSGGSGKAVRRRLEPRSSIPEDVEEWRREKEARQIAKTLSSGLVLIALTNPEAAFWPIYNSLCGEIWTQKPDKLLVERVIEVIRLKNAPSGGTN